ncbi:MAG: M15 family metallopeptidase [Hyphomicrobiaceae bacterium]|nr:M15 family metallopeptidase [Hyphomicrobiaceae bacterium]
MTAHPLNERSIKNLAGVHPDLVRVVEQAALRCEVPIVVTEGLRTQDRQKQLKAAGKSWTLNSRHLTGHAVDLVDADNYGYDIPDLDKIAAAMKSAADECGIPIVWGGDWKSKDTPHFELDRKAYPATGVSTGTLVAEKIGTIAKARATIATTVGAGAVVVKEASDAVTGIDTPLVPAVSKGVAETVTNVAGWSKVLAGHDASVFLVGAAVFAGVAGMSWAIAKVRS